MNKTPFCRECKFFGGKVKCKNVYHETIYKGICTHEKGGIYEHILDRNNWCCNGEFRDEKDKT